jgi:hypothetical protein
MKIGLVAGLALFLAASTAAAFCVGGAPNGTTQGGEECDDGRRDDDCCTDACTFVAENTSCNDRNSCTQASGDHCNAVGACVGGEEIVCEDDNPCTDDVCRPKGPPSNPCNFPWSGPIACTPEAVSDGDPACANGVCQHGECLQTGWLPENTPCTGDETECERSEGFCQSHFCELDDEEDGTPCTGAGGACRLTEEAACQGGTCVTPVSPDGTPCAGQPGACKLTDQAACESGVCATPLIADGTGCDDSNPCTLASACTSGSCLGTACKVPGTCELCQSTCQEALPYCGCVPQS